jgi:hypothetical protein
VKNNRLALTLGIVITSTFILLSSCKKINEATELGDDLIPPIDNITTFDTTLYVQVFNDSFTLATDSTLSDPSYTHYLGHINSDPFFGKTDAKIFLELKPRPEQYPYTFANKKDSLYLDSVVLVLDYVETYGDTMQPQNITVREITSSQISDFRYDTTYRLRENSIPVGASLGSRTVTPATLNDSVKSYLDTTKNQLRIRLDNAFGTRLLNYDSTGAYKNDSNFRQNFKGFQLESGSGNAVMGFNLSGTNTKLAIYYRYNNHGVSNIDTTVTYWTLGTFSATANLVQRDHTGTPFAASVNGTTLPPDDFAYIQATPGSFATLRIPDLPSLGNRVVHRAELIMEQVYDAQDTIFPPPHALYLDAWETSTSSFRNIPFDFFFDASGNSNLASFGAVPFSSADQAGNPIKTWRFNLSRYIQHVVNGTAPVYDLRLYAPVYTYNQYYASPTATATKAYIGVNPAPVRGRVRLRGGDNSATPNPQRMRLRIVYSKI